MSYWTKPLLNLIYHCNPFFFFFCICSSHSSCLCLISLNVCVLGLPVCSAAHCVCLKYSGFLNHWTKKEGKKSPVVCLPCHRAHMVSSQPRLVVWLLDCLVECLLADSETWRQPRCHSVRRFRHVLDVELFISRAAGALASHRGPF